MLWQNLTLYMNGVPTMTMKSIDTWEGSIDFTVIGGIIVEDTSVTGG